MFKSKVEIVIVGINIEKSFELKKYIYKDYVDKIKINKLEGRSIQAVINITSEDKLKNKFIADEFKDFLMKLFSLFGVCTRIKSFDIKPKYDDICAIAEIRPPMLSVDENEINKMADKIKDNLDNINVDHQFLNLIESNKKINMIHRFRALFSTFDSLAPKDNNHINYNQLKSRYVSIIEQLYVNQFELRLIKFIEEFIKADLVNERCNNPKNYSNNLKESIQNLDDNTDIKEEIAFNILKCIQMTRNKIIHGEFDNISYKLVSTSYELLLPLTKELLKDSM